MKSDLLRAAVVGEMIAILTLPILKNINFHVSLVFWLIFLPAATLSGFYLIYILARKRPVLLQIGKYGLIGCLNFFLDAGIFNFFILITGIANGWLTNVFIAVAFCVTTTQSFFWNKFWIFGSKGLIEYKTEYFKFFSITIATSLLGLFFMHLIINIIGAPRGFDLKLWANLALLVLIPISVLGNFLSYKFFVFKKST